MKETVFLGKYKDIDAFFVENDALLACFLPANGGKMASLVYKRSGREFLVQAAGDRYRPLRYDDEYVDAECSGFDDMFPTIDRGYYELPPWRGIPLPDHGEVCALRWDWIIVQNELQMQVHGVRFPYLLRKTIGFHNGALQMDYCCENLSDDPMDFIWAAHLMLNAQEAGQILVPYQSPAKAVCVYTEDPGFGRYGESIDWPRHTGADGVIRHLDFTPACNAQGNNYKYYFAREVPEGWCGYRYPDGTTLIVSFDKQTVPYLGIWVNEGSFKGYQNVALEPCTGTYDRPDRARLHGQFSVLPAKSRIKWQMAFSVTD